MRFLTYPIEGHWVADTLTPAEIGARTIEMLRRLEPLAPAMNNWLFAEGEDCKPLSLADAAPRMAALVEGNLAWQSEDAPSDAVCGYAVRVGGAPKRRLYGAPDMAHISLRAGGQVDDEIEFEIGSAQLPKDYSLITYPVYRGALEVFAAVWQLPWAYAYTYSASNPPIDAPADWTGLKRPVFEGAWVAYLSQPLALGLKPPPELVAESTPGGGVILSAVQGLIDTSDPDHMRRSRALQDVMAEQVGVTDVYYRRPADHAARIGPY